MSFVSYEYDALAVGCSGSLTTLILPSNLDQLDKVDVLNLLKRVVSERNNLSTEMSRLKKKPCLNHAYSAQQPASAATVASPVSFDVIGAKKLIFQKATSKIKKTTHTVNGKPYTSVVAKDVTEASMMKLINVHEPKLNSSNRITWLLNEEEVLDWLNIRDTPHIHPVANKMRRFFMIYGSNTTNEVYVHAGIESVDIKWSSKSGTLHLKFRTKIVATGSRPKYKVNFKDNRCER